MKVVTSTTEKHFIEETIKKGLRLDGRTLRSGRSVEIAFSQEHGCCIAVQGNTRVLAQVSCELTTPNAARPSEGTLQVNLELSPMADPEFKTGAMSDEAVEASRLLDRCVRDSRCIELESLCVVSGEKVWAIRVDVQALNNDGNVIECASIATIASLAHFRRPFVSVIGTEVTVHSLEDHNPVALTLHHMPLAVNLAIFDCGEHIVVDPLELEERVSKGNVVIAMNAHQEICLLHLSGPVSLKKDVLLMCIDIAAKRAQTLTQIIRAALDNDSYQRATKQPTGFTTLLQTSTILGARRPISQIDSSKFTVEAEEHEVIDMEESNPDQTGELVTEALSHVSEVRQEVEKFLGRPEVAVFEGGKSSWELDEESSSEEEDTGDGINHEKKPQVTSVKKEKPDNTLESVECSENSSDDDDEEERVCLKSEHMETSSRGWYSKNPFF